MVLSPVSEEDTFNSKGRKAKAKGEAKKGDTEKIVVKKKPEKPVRILRIRYYEKISLPFMQNGKLEHKDIFAVDRGIQDLLKSLYYNTDIRGMVTPAECIFVEKDSRMGSNNKFIFINIGTNEFYILKKQLENYTTISAFNKGEFSILDGKISSLSETFGMTRIWKNDDKPESPKISDTNVILARRRLKEELKDKFRSYHSYEDDEIDNMSERALIELKRLSKKKMEIEKEKIDSIVDKMR